MNVAISYGDLFYTPKTLHICFVVNIFWQLKIRLSDANKILLTANNKAVLYRNFVNSYEQGNDLRL